MRGATPTLVAISLKTYFGHNRTLEWCAAIARLAAQHPAVTGGQARLVVLPTFVSLAAAADAFAGTPVELGGQDICPYDDGSCTGEVTGSQLVEVGCTYAEVGHAERRKRFGEDDAVVAAKITAVLRNGLQPLLCVGEPERGDPEDAARAAVAELARVVEASRAVGLLRPITVAYEPHWAIGAPRPAPAGHVSQVCHALGEFIASEPPLAGSQVVYGGSAGPGSLTALRHCVQGLFLGRFAHEPAVLADVLDEIAE